ncbi:MAG TPA: phosphomethylpyrimidine synthase ThiC, partial [Rhizobacter sp.]|nr:phosphomethylpyrimidine synthase ThiC [Rhizobacter sp.]
MATPLIGIDDPAALSRRITRTPFAGSRKVYLPGSRPDIQVPFREIVLSDTLTADGRREPNPPLRVYDSSGPYTDPQAEIDITRGLPPLRAAWIAERSGSANQSQMHFARRNIVTPEMEFVAVRENLLRAQLRERLAQERPAHAGQAFGARLARDITPEFVRAEVAAGRAISPANIRHPESEPMAIGRNF